MSGIVFITEILGIGEGLNSPSPGQIATPPGDQRLLEKSNVDEERHYDDSK